MAGAGPELVAVVGIEDTTRYSSGTTDSKIIMNGPKGTVFYIEPSTPEFTEKQGQYGFDAFPAGDYIVRFRYGDHYDTILTNDPKNEVYQLLTNGDSNSVYSGKNKKSYNGQDFKSTVYQAGVNQGSVTQYHPGCVDNGSGKNIDGFVRFEDAGGVTAQHYRNYRADTDNENIDGNKSAFVANYQKMYSYDIDLSESASNISDAKDVYKYRDIGLAYAGTLTNHNSEVLDSFEKLATTDYPIWYKYTDTSGKTSSLTSEYIKYLGSDDRVKNELSITNATNEVDFNKISSVEVIIPEKTGESSNKDALISKQKGMIEEFKENSQQMAQSGIINVNIEKNKSLTTVGDISYETYELGGIDFGVAERPEAQLLLNKEVDKLKFTLTNGSTLFETQGPAADLIFTKHSSHDAKYEAHKLKSVNRTINKKLFPEIIQGYIDEEVLNGATIEVTYKFSLRNVGEVDYNGLRFYYTGTGQDTSSTAEVTRTKADYIIDYISKDLKYTDQKQIDSTTWRSISKDELVPSHNNPEDTTHDLINSVYYDELASYGDSNLSYMITDQLSGTSDGKAGLLPEALNVGASSVGPIYMILTTNTSFYDVNSTYTYNNLCEVIQISNDQGRRMQYSITGNQPMADQETKNNAVYEEDNKNYSRIQLVTPSEVDADSAQQILFIPPTGEDRDYTLVTFIAVSAATIVAVGYIIIRRSLMAKEKAKVIK